MVATAAQAAGKLAVIEPGANPAVSDSSPEESPAQQTLAGPDQQNSPSPTATTRVPVHGTVRDAASGEPLPRALVRIEGDAEAGTLTDGDGRFEIPNVPTGPQIFQIIKPGFRDQAVAGMIAGAAIVNGATNSEHNVHVAADMPDLVFNMTPTNAIRGQIDLSTGDPAQGIGVVLLRRSMQDGRAVWQAAANTRTNSDGGYRFAGLADGIYVVYTEPAMDTEVPVSLVESGNDRMVARAGYASLFYPDARDLSGAGRIQIAGGQQAQANLLLTEEPFRFVRAAVTLPGAQPITASDRSAMNMTCSILDAQGHALPYAGQFDIPTRSVQAFLPDGTYSLLVTSLIPPRIVHAQSRYSFKDTAPEGQLTGQVEFSVAGHAPANLRIPLTVQHSNAVQISLIRTNAQQADAGSQGSPIVVMLSQAGGWISDGMTSAYAEGYPTGPIETTFMSPGAYWAHTSIPQKGLCEASFTAGGASLAREPLVLSLSGATAPLTLTLRDDCASLKISLPPSLDSSPLGDEPYYTVYVVPDFDSTADVTPVTLRPSSGGSFTLDGLTPGSYHVYAFAAPVELEYRNTEAMAALPNPGQAVTLSPSTASNLILEVPGH